MRATKGRLLFPIGLSVAVLAFALNVTDVSESRADVAKSPNEIEGGVLPVSYTISEGSGEPKSRSVSNWTNPSGRGLGEKIYAAARYVDRSNLSIDKLNVRLIVSECDDRKYGSNYKVPSGSFTVEAIEKISGFDSRKGFLESDFWREGLLDVIRSNYDRCQGSFS